MKSHLTAISRKKASTPCEWLHKNGYLQGRCLDYGCGKGKDAEIFEREKYDPFYHPQTLEGQFDTITCIYVLNVVQQQERESIIAKVRQLLNVGGRAYFVVRRDIIKEGPTSRGTWQENVVLPYVCVREALKQYAIYEMRKE